MSSWTLPFGKRTTADEVVAELDLSGKLALVTGANTGIGFETARALAARGARTVLACRRPERGEAAAARIRAQHPAAEVQVGELDLGSLGAVRRFVDGLAAERLEMLVCNAGVYGGGYNETADGFERTVGVCHIGHFLLTRLLLPRVINGGGRVVLVSSESHRHPRTLDFDRLPLQRSSYSNMVAYGQAKLCNLLFAYELQRRFGEQGVAAYAVHPGAMVPTELGRHSRAAAVVFKLASPFTKSPAQAAAPSVLCAAHPELGQFAGGYFVDCRPRESSPESQRPEVAARLWQLSEEWTGLSSSG